MSAICPACNKDSGGGSYCRYCGTKVRTATLPLPDLTGSNYPASDFILICADTQKQFPVPDGITVIGRGFALRELVEHKSDISRAHAQLMVENGQLYIQDLHSTNGTYVNGVRLDQSRLALHPGDFLALASQGEKGAHFTVAMANTPPKAEELPAQKAGEEKPAQPFAAQAPAAAEPARQPAVLAQPAVAERPQQPTEQRPNAIPPAQPKLPAQQPVQPQPPAQKPAQQPVQPQPQPAQPKPAAPQGQQTVPPQQPGRRVPPQPQPAQPPVAPANAPNQGPFLRFYYMQPKDFPLGIVCRHGRTPSGGAFSVAFYRDSQGRLCDSKSDRFLEIHECDGLGNSIRRHYLEKKNGKK